MLSRRGDDRGNVLLTMPVFMVVVLLAAAVFAQSHLALRQSRIDTDEAKAAAGAELAVNEAFARIDAGETAGFTDTSSLDDTAFTYRAVPIDSETWEITAQATNGVISRALAATVTREPQHAHTLFVVDTLRLDRNTGRIRGRVGTNGTMTINGPSPGSQQDLYRPDGSCTGCAAPLTLDGPYTVTPLGSPSEPTQPCPLDGRFEGPIDGRGGLLFLCDDRGVDVEFVGDVTVVDPPLRVQVGTDVPLVLDGARVNVSGRAADFQLFVAGAATDTVSSFGATGFRASGLVYAPGRSVTTDSFEVAGSVTVRALTMARGGRVEIAPDATVEDLGRRAWRIVDLRSVAST